MDDRVESVSLLQHKIWSQCDMCSPELLELLHLALKKVRQTSDVKMAPVPVWFISPRELKIDQSSANSETESTTSATAPALRCKWSSADVMITQHRLPSGNFIDAIDKGMYLKHPNMVTMFGASHLWSRIMAVTESVSSTSLREYMKPEENKHLLWQKLFEVALGLKYLGDHGIAITSILRCDEIWIGADGMAKINVLGCVLPGREQQEYAHWQAPEILRGEPASAASSVFSLGMCALEAWTGVIEGYASVSSSDLLRHQPELPEQTTQAQRDLLQPMLDPDPSKRPSLSSVIHTLKQFAAGQEDNNTSLEEFSFEAIDAAAEPIDDDDDSARPPWFISAHELKYDRNALISTGAIGNIYRASWCGNPVMIKFIRNGADGDAPSRCKLFFHELRMWFPLRHPHVTKLYGACHTGGRFFVSENAEHGTLTEYLKLADGNPSQTWQLLYQVALDLQYLHKFNVVHNDLKCGNIFIGTDNTANIANFDLSSTSKVAEVQIDPEKYGAVHWRSPEYLRGDQLTLTSDIYSFGMLILEAMTDEKPWGTTIDTEVKL